MTKSAPEPHPLDDEYVPTPGKTAEPSSRTEAYKPLLKPSVFALIAGFVVTFLAGVAASNAPPNSAVESISTAISQIAAFVMLGGGLCILIAYRIPYIQRIVSQKSGLRWFESGFVNLVLGNVAGIVIIWFSLFALYALSAAAGAPIVAIVASGVLIIYIALLITMTVFHNNYLRAYAIGSLTACPLALYSWINLLWTVTYRASTRGGSGSALSVWPYGAFITFSACTGMICAGYVLLITYFESRRKLDATDADPKTPDSHD